MKTIHPVLTDQQAAALHAIAMQRGIRHTQLASDIIAAFLAKPDAAALADELADAMGVSPAVRKDIERREKIVLAWVEARKQAKRRDGLGAAAQRFIDGLQRRHGVKISRATLYNWHTRYFHKGRAGLIDQRFSNGGLVQRRIAA